MTNLASLGLLLTTSLSLLACSSSGNTGDDEPPAPDAPVATPDGTPPTPDGPPAGTAATVVPCEGATIAGDIWFYDGIGFLGSALNVDSPVGSIVQFHSMSVHTADHVQGLFSASGDAPICVRFDAVGSYEFACYFHGEETGAINIVD